MHNETVLFKVLADPTRLRLAVLLSVQGEKCVCQLAEALNEPEFKISRHLGIMRTAGMVMSVLLGQVGVEAPAGAVQL